MIFLTILFSIFPMFSPSDQKTDYQHLIGTEAIEWEIQDWINSEPIHLKDLKGKVVLVRWWTGPFCPYCIHSAPALNEWHEKYYDDGLRVIGMYHHKSRRYFNPDYVADLAEKKGFTFPVAIDPRWKNLKTWWLDKVEGAAFTSVSFLVDQEGKIAFIHPGGEYVKGDGEYEELEGVMKKVMER